VRGSTLVSCPSPSGSCSARRVALYWLPALPPRRLDDLGVFLVEPYVANQRRETPPRSSLLGFSPLQSVVSVASARRAPPRDHAGLPLVRFLLPRTQLRRVPLLRHELPCGRPCGARIARPSPVPSSGFLPLSTVSAGTRLSPWPPTLRSSCLSRRRVVTARVPGAPLQSFPFPGSRTRSRGPLLPCGFALRLSPAQCLRGLHDRFRPSRQLFAARARPKADTGLMSRDDGSLRSLVRSPRHTEVCRTYRPLLTDNWARREQPARPLRSLAPPGSPFRNDPNTWPG